MTSMRSVACVECHAAKVSLEPEQPAATCTACHDEHHAAGLDCASCHRTAGIMEAHAPPIDAHRACDAVPHRRTVAALEPTRSFCLACHGAETDHYAAEGVHASATCRASPGGLPGAG